MRLRIIHSIIAICSLLVAASYTGCALTKETYHDPINTLPVLLDNGRGAVRTPDDVPNEDTSNPPTGCPLVDPADCGNFKCQPEAQAYFENLKRITGGRDCAGLDADVDEIACEALPRTCP